MSQQRIIIALCVLGAVATAAAQRWDGQSCLKKVRQEADIFRESMVSAARKFTSSLQNTAGQAIDTSDFQRDLDKLTSNIQQMADVSQGIDMGRLSSMYLDNLGTMASLMRSSLRLNLVSGTMSNYIEFGNALYSSQTGFMQRVTDGCMPQTRATV